MASIQISNDIKNGGKMEELVTKHHPLMKIIGVFIDDVFLNHVGGKELKSFDGVGIGRITKKEKNDMGLPKEPNKEWKQNEKVVPTNKENVDHYQWHPTKIPHLNCIIKES
ncbi:hypothetical protein Tco_1548914 [Tanacetum coccineum]